MTDEREDIEKVLTQNELLSAFVELAQAVFNIQINSGYHTIMLRGLYQHNDQVMKTIQSMEERHNRTVEHLTSMFAVLDKLRGFK